MENFQKISDYSKLSNLQNLKSLEFLHQMPRPTSLVILTTRIKSKDYSSILSIKSFAHLSMPPQHALLTCEGFREFK
ncbi:hypothetical protein [Campylobacter concisus]